MTNLSYPARVAAAIEYAETHLAVCRYRRQNLVCSACSDLVERANRLIDARHYGACSCGADDYLIGGLCEPCRVTEAA